MTRARRTAWSLVVAANLVAGCGGPPPESPQPTPSAPEWRPLFDGRSLSGWRRLGGEAEYGVVDGAIVGTSRLDTPNTFLASEETFGDFALELQFQVDPELNSGVQVRSLSRPDHLDGRVHGYQVEIDPSERAWSAGIYDEARRGWLYPLTLNDAAGAAFRPGEWNTLYVECLGNAIRTWLNDVPVAHVIDAVTPEGFVALQVHSVEDASLAGRQVRWRDIRVWTSNVVARDGSVPFVANYVPNDLSAAEHQDGWTLLWDGRTSAGWRGAHADAFPETGWSMEDGVLRVEESGGGEASHGGDIVTEGEYAAFELQLDFMLSEGANSGIKYFVTEEYDAGGGSAIGLEYQLLDDERHPDARQGRDGNRTLASLYDLVPAAKQPRFVKPPGDWNHARLVVWPDGRIEHWLNHMKVLEYVRGSDAFLELVRLSKYRDWEGFGLWEKGHLLLQDHGNRVSFRSIKLRPLRDETEAS